MDIFYIYEEDNGGYVYHRYEAIIDVFDEMFQKYNICEMPYMDMEGGYFCIKLPDEIHIMYEGKDLAADLNVDCQLVYNDDGEVLAKQYQDDVVKIIDIVENNCGTEVEYTVGDEKIPYRYWKSYFCGDNDVMIEMLSEYGTDDNSLLYEGEESFSKLWHKYGRYFVCDILSA